MTDQDAASRCWLEVDLDVICENYRAAQSMMQSGAVVIPVLKANAYGMNAVVIAETLRDAGASLFAVATADEAEQLLNRINGIQVLPMGLVGEGAMRRLIHRGALLTLYSENQGRQIAAIARDLGKAAKVHVKIDTGLHRLGFDPETAADTIAALCADGAIQPCGLYTHLAIHTAEMDAVQLEKLEAVRAALAMRGIAVPLVHAVDSIGMVRYPQGHLGAVRVGAWLYGVCPRNAPAPCRAPARFRARVSQVRDVAAGELIGYDDDHPLDRDCRIATVSAGYVDGTPRIGNAWQVELHGQRANVIGIACMDQMMIDVSDIPDVHEGDVVTFVGGAIGIDEYADMGGFNRNEAWARIGRRVPRIFYQKGQPVRVCAEVSGETWQ